MEGFMSAIDWQGFKDIVIVLGAIFAIYLGFQMYEHAVDTTSSTQAEMRTHLVTISMNGGGPGIASMFLGAAILIVALLMGRAVSGGGGQVLGGRLLSHSQAKQPTAASDTDASGLIKALAMNTVETLQNLPEDAGQAKQSNAVTKVATNIRDLSRDASVADSLTLLRNAGAERDFKELALGQNWQAHVDRSSENENISFLLSMRDIWTLGLATFEGANVQEAKLTEHGKMVRDYLNRQTVTQLPDSPTVGLQHRKTLPRRGVVPLTPDGSQVGCLFSEYADNWYKFRIDETSDYIIRTSEPEPAATGVDTVIVLYDSNNNQIGVDDDSGDDTYSVLQKELDAGNYNLRVSSYEGRRGGYTLMVNKRSEVPQKDAVFVEEHERPSDEDVQELSADCKLVGQPLDKDEALWFKLDVTENDKYTIKTSPPKSGSGVDTIIHLYAKNPWRLLGDDDDGSENALFYSSLVKDLSTGTYYIRVSSFWLEDPGNFQISVCNGQEGS